MQRSGGFFPRLFTVTATLGSRARYEEFLLPRRSARGPIYHLNADATVAALVMVAILKECTVSNKANP